MTPPTSGPPPTDPALDDPMLRVLRERHPEVDVVVLPQTAPAPAPETTAAQRAALAADLDSSLGDLLARLSRDPAWAGATRDARWRTDEWGLTWYESAAVVGPLAEGGNMALLRAARHALLALGWQVRPVPGDRPRLAARRRGGLEATATVRPHELVVTARAAKVRVAPDEAPDASAGEAS
jgi:hypothetical protein